MMTMKIDNGVRRMETKFVRIESEDELPPNVVRNLSRPNLFGCLYTDYVTKKVKVEKGLLAKEEEVFLFSKKINKGLIDLLREKTIEFNSAFGNIVFIRKANVTLYYIKS